MDNVQEWYFDEPISLLEETVSNNNSEFKVEISGYTEIDHFKEAGELIFKFTYTPKLPVQALNEIRVRIKSKTDIFNGTEGVVVVLNEWDFIQKSFITYVRGTGKFFEESTIELIMGNPMGDDFTVFADQIPVQKVLETWNTRFNIPNTRDYLDDEEYVFNDDEEPQTEGDPDADDLT